MTAAITYYALTPIVVDGKQRMPGDLTPEVALWRMRNAYLDTNQVATVLVSTLPANKRKQLEDWENGQTQIPKPLVEVMSNLDPEPDDDEIELNFDIMEDTDE